MTIDEILTFKIQSEKEIRKVKILIDKLWNYSMEQDDEAHQFAEILEGWINFRRINIEEVQESLEELQWYRSQDLIPRDMALDIYYNCPQAYDCDISLCDECAIKRINEIPKAEPPTSSKMEQVGKDINVPRNGDCETCKHYAEDWFDCDSCGEKNFADYEPYIPKENER